MWISCMDHWSVFCNILSMPKTEAGVDKQIVWNLTDFNWSFTLSAMEMISKGNKMGTLVGSCILRILNSPDIWMCVHFCDKTQSGLRNIGLGVRSIKHAYVLFAIFFFSPGSKVSTFWPHPTQVDRPTQLICIPDIYRRVVLLELLTQINVNCNMLHITFGFFLCCNILVSASFVVGNYFWVPRF